MSKALSVRRTLEAITAAMALVLVVTCAISANGAYDEMRRAERIVTASGITRDLFMSMQYRRFELGTESTALESPRAVDAGTWADIEQVRARLLAKNWASEDELKKIDAAVRAVVNEASEFATSDPEPDPSELYTDVYR